MIPRWVRIADLFDDGRYRQLTRELPSSRRGEVLQSKYDKVRSIRDYEVPVVRMVDHNFNEAVEAFTRINTLATRLKQQDIESARVAETHSGLISDDVVPFMRTIEDGGFSRLNVMHLFRACAFIARPDGRARTPLHELSRQEVDVAWKSDQEGHAGRSESGEVRARTGEYGHSVVGSVPGTGHCSARDDESERQGHQGDDRVAGVGGSSGIATADRQRAPLIRT
jgi:hypothetical protein